MTTPRIYCAARRQAKTLEQERIRNAAPQLLEALEVMTSLVRIKYGNLDSDVYAEIKKADALIKSAKGE